MFLPETTQETKDIIKNVIGSWRLEGLEPSPETIRDIELVELGKLTYDEAVELAIKRANAKIRELYRPQKRQVTVRIDADVLEWLKSSGKGYQTRLNEILRHEMLESKTHIAP